MLISIFAIIIIYWISHFPSVFFVIVIYESSLKNFLRNVQYLQFMFSFAVFQLNPTECQIVNKYLNI